MDEVQEIPNWDLELKSEELSLEDKRLAGLKLFLKKHPQVKKVKVVTKNLERKEDLSGIEIEMVPLWQFLLSSKP